MKKYDVLVTQIMSKIPPNINAVDYLMDVLNIGRESVYRRLRGKIPFTFGEVTKLSQELDFSVDEIIGKSKAATGYVDLHMKLSAEPEEAFLHTLREFYDHLRLVNKSVERETIVTLNRLLLPMLVGYRSLFRFFYYKWIHQRRDVPINYSMAELVMSSELQSLYRKIDEHLRSVKDNNIYIFDSNLFLSAIKDVQYYYKRRLITDDDLELLKEDFMLMFSRMESMGKKGCNEIGSVSHYYLSTLHIGSNNIYTRSDDKVVSYIWPSPVNPIMVTDPAACAEYKNWLNSLKKYAILITLSNEIMLADFMNRQRAYLENIGGGVLT